MKRAFDALIVGGGPAGSSAAIALAQAGWSVALIEKQAYPRRKVCGECVAASNLPLLESLGIRAEFLQQAGPELRQTALMHKAETVLADLPPSLHARDAWGRALGRETLDVLLIERARALGASIFQPWAVQKIQGAAGFHQCTVREMASDRLVALQAPVVILAHGSWEPLPADRADHRLARKSSSLLAFKANFRAASLPPGLLPVLMFPGGYGGMVLAEQGLVTLACCIRVDRLAALRRAAPGLPVGDVVQQMLLRECQGVKDAISDAVRIGPWLASGPLAPGVRLKKNEDVFRIGNAAGEAHPIIGEGISMALQSAAMLCALLIRAKPAADRGAMWQKEVQTEYARAWRRRFVPRMRLAALFAYVAMRPLAAAALSKFAKRWPEHITQGAVQAGKIWTLGPASAPQDRPRPAIPQQPSQGIHL